MKNNHLVLDGAPSGLPPAISEATDAYGRACELWATTESARDEQAVDAAREALESAILSALPREEPQPAPAECADCGAPMNGGEAATFTVCSTCWDRHYRPAPSGEALKALDEVVATIQFHHERGGRWGIALTNLALVRVALSGLPQPTPEPRCVTCGADMGDRASDVCDPLCDSERPRVAPPSPTLNETLYFRWAYALNLALAKHLFENRTEGWPDHDWSELVSSSHTIFLREAREKAGIDHEAFLAVVRGPEIDVGDLYARACGCKQCRADYPEAFGSPPSPTSKEG